jgi:CDP-diacylglycerol--serine O-phosphatidyltransferase
VTSLCSNCKVCVIALDKNLNTLAYAGVFQRLPTAEQEKKSLLALRKVIPNSLTVLALITGLTSVPLALRKEYQWSVIAVFLAGMTVRVCVCLRVNARAFVGILDGLDGPAARLLNSTSRFGAELDSLCDLVNFGVAPCLVIYLWRLYTLGWQGWLLSVLWCICMASRLARFNAGVDFNQEKWSRSFFTGVPAPAGACLVMAPLAAAFRFGDHVVADDRVLVPYVVFISFMLVSHVPTFSSKMIHSSTFRGTARTLAALVLAGAFAAAVVTDLWLTYLVIAAAYVMSFPVSYYYFCHLASQHSHEKDL